MTARAASTSRPSGRWSSPAGTSAWRRTHRAMRPSAPTAGSGSANTRTWPERERPVVHPDHDGHDGLGQAALDLDEGVDGQSHEVGHRRSEDDDQRVDIGRSLALLDGVRASAGMARWVSWSTPGEAGADRQRIQHLADGVDTDLRRAQTLHPPHRERAAPGWSRWTRRRPGHPGAAADRRARERCRRALGPSAPWMTPACS